MTASVPHGAEPPAVPEGAEPPAASDRAALASASWTGQVGRPTRLLLLRHGQTEMSAQRRYSGRADPALTPLGREQAAAVAAGIGSVADGPAAAAFTSPLRRARQTAEPAAAALGVDAEPHDGLLETDFGAWDGLTFTEARERDPDLHARWLGDDTVSPPGGESFAEVGARVAALREELVAAYPGRTVLLVSHVTPIKTLLRQALDAGPALLFRLHLDLASLSIAEFYPDGGASVRLVNRTFS